MDIGTIAKRENLAERHVRFLTPLAYLSPRIIEAIAEGRAPCRSDRHPARPQPADSLGGPGKAARVRLIRHARRRAPAHTHSFAGPVDVLDDVEANANRSARTANRSPAKPTGKFRRLENRALETGRTMDSRDRPIPGGLQSPRPQRPAECGPLRRSWRSLRIPECVAGAGGFEPPDGGIKIRCLTTWLRPNAPQGSEGLAESGRTIVRGVLRRNGPSRTKFAPVEGEPAHA